MSGHDLSPYVIPLSMCRGRGVLWMSARPLYLYFVFRTTPNTLPKCPRVFFWGPNPRVPEEWSSSYKLTKKTPTRRQVVYPDAPVPLTPVSSRGHSVCLPDPYFRVSLPFRITWTLWFSCVILTPYLKPSTPPVSISTCRSSRWTWCVPSLNLSPHVSTPSLPWMTPTDLLRNWFYFRRISY